MTVLRRDSSFRNDPLGNRSEGFRPGVAQLLAMVDLEDPSAHLTTALLSDMVAAGVTLGETAVDIAVKLAKWRWSWEAREMARSGAIGPYQPQLAEVPSIVYYVRRGDLIKIGTTTDPSTRFRELMPDEILAFEPGGIHEETLRHRQFHHIRQGARAEYFRITPELVRHIRQVRAAHGNPDPLWPTTANIGVRRRRQQEEGFPISESGEMVTVAEAALRLGIQPRTIRGWVGHKKLRPAGIGDDGLKLYYLEHVVYLSERGHPSRRLPSEEC